MSSRRSTPSKSAAAAAAAAAAPHHAAPAAAAAALPHRSRRPEPEPEPDQGSEHDVEEFVENLSDYSGEEESESGSDSGSEESDGTHITVDLSENELYKGLAPLLEDAEGRTIIDVMKDGHILASRNHQEIISCIAELVNELRKMNETHEKYYRLMKAVHHNVVQEHNARSSDTGSHPGTFGSGSGSGSNQIQSPGSGAAAAAAEPARHKSSSSRR